MKTYKPLELQQAQDLSDFILHHAKKMGANEAEVDFVRNRGFSIGVHDANVETIEYHQDKVIDITVYFGKKSGTAGLTDMRHDAVLKAIEAACHIAKYTDEDEASGLADKSMLAFGYKPLDTFHPWSITVDEAIKLAMQCEKLATQGDPRIKAAEEVGLVTIESQALYANSHGFIGIVPSSQHEISCVLVAEDKNDMQRDYSYTVAVDPSDLTPIEALAHQAKERTLARLGGKKITTTKAPVIFIAQEARGLLGHFASAISGSMIYKKTSFLLDQLGEQLFPKFITMQEKPFLQKARGTSPFDDEGVATRENIFVKEGCLLTYALSTYAARKLGMRTTANAGGMHNLTITTNMPDLMSMIKQMQRGLIVTEVMGQGVNLVTGDYSRGAAGFWVENGEIQFPVHEITIAGHLKDMYRNIVAVGGDLDTRGNIRTGSIMIEEMTIAGE